MALRTRYSSLDMIRMANLARENQDLKPIPLIKLYNETYPEITPEQKLKNIRNWLDDNEVMTIVEADTSCECEKVCSCEVPKHNYPEMVWCDNCGLIIKEKQT